MSEVLKIFAEAKHINVPASRPAQYVDNSNGIAELITEQEMTLLPGATQFEAKRLHNGNFELRLPSDIVAFRLSGQIRDNAGHIHLVKDGIDHRIIDSRSSGDINRSYVNVLDPDGGQTNKRGEKCLRIHFNIDPQTEVAAPRTRTEGDQYTVQLTPDALQRLMRSIPARTLEAA